MGDYEPNTARSSQKRDERGTAHSVRYAATLMSGPLAEKIEMDFVDREELVEFYTENFLNHCHTYATEHSDNPGNDGGCENEKRGRGWNLHRRSWQG